MSWIDKLGILGIRSFSPDDPVYIQFSSPCTVIYGPNGTGKTTIIEALKYACTGDLPPNSKQGAFIHDVKVAGVSEVRAQIRLQFYSCNNMKVICTRTLSLTQKKTTVSQKTLDTSLKLIDPANGEVTSVSTRCADMDVQLPQHLGVSKAILDNVVFCHQEESNWPLSEPAVLKKKLDEIFASTRYTKALATIKDNRKELTQENKVETVALSALKNDTEKARKITRILSDLKTRVINKKQQAAEIDEELDETTSEINSLLEKYREAEKIEGQIRQLIHEEKIARENMNELGKNLTERSETDEELQMLLDSISGQAQKDDETRQDLEFEAKRVDRQLNTARETISSKLTTMGRLEAAAEANKKLEKERAILLRQTNEELGLASQSGLMDADRAIQAIKELVRAREGKLQKIKDEAREQQSNLSSQLQSLKSERGGLEESKKNAKRQVQQARNTTRSLNEQLDNIHTTQADLDENNLNDTKKMLDDGGLPLKLSQKDKELRDVDDQIALVNEEMSRLNRQGDTQTKLSLKRLDLDSKRTTARSLFNENSSEIQSRLGRESSMESLDQDLTKLLNEKTTQLQKLQETKDCDSRELSGVEAKLSVAKESLFAKQQQALEYEQQINEVCGDKSLPDEMNALEKTLTQTREQLGSLDGAKSMYQRFHKRTIEYHCCALCKRTYSSDQEVEYKTFLKALEDAVKNIPKKEESFRKNIGANEKKLAKLKSLQTTWNQLKTLRDTELVDLKKTVDNYTDQRKLLASKIDTQNMNIMDLKEEKQRIEWLYKRAEEISRYKKEARQLEQDVVQLESELGRTGSTRTVTDCQRELEDLSDKSKTIRRDLRRLNDDRETVMHQIQAANNAVHGAREIVRDVKHKLENRERIERQIEQVQNELKSYMQQLQVFKKEQDIEKISSQLLRIQSTWSTKQDEAQTSVNQAQQSLERLEGLNREIAEYTRGTGTENIERLSEEKRLLELKVEDLQEKRNDTDKKIRDIEKQILDRKGSERELSDHIRHRALKKELTECRLKLNELKGQRSRFERASYERQMETHKARQEQLIAERGGIHGEIRQMEVQVERYQSDLNVDYEDVEVRYHDQYVQLKMNEFALTDLEKYTKALEQAIMRYHTIKMEDLNKLIREMWIETYRGGDIDYIEIRSDNEGNSASNRSYNYRVVMIKNSKEVNMRGRCSAGQKVLTSIIVRLALAEAFCVNCGILTLDEPTTNLDRDNIESLATNLSRLVQSRRASHSHFQLIIITHDTEFVEQLRRSNVAEYFNYVHKDDK
ncbi:AAA domain-containing protein [Circinella umbellata]|nr:AAA domain-containing protein [Circinella umbellata]